jgi:hypothetical protein
MKNKTIKDYAPYIAALAAVGAAAAAAIIAYSRTSKALNELDVLPLDFGNDDAVLAFFHNKMTGKDQ